MWKKHLPDNFTQKPIEEYDDGSAIFLSGYDGGNSDGGAWGGISIMRIRADGETSFRDLSADGNWRDHQPAASVFAHDEYWPEPDCDPPVDDYDDFEDFHIPDPEPVDMKGEAPARESVREDWLTQIGLLLHGRGVWRADIERVLQLARSFDVEQTAPPETPYWSASIIGLHDDGTFTTKAVLSQRNSVTGEQVGPSFEVEVTGRNPDELVESAYAALEAKRSSFG